MSRHAERGLKPSPTFCKNRLKGFNSRLGHAISAGRLEKVAYSDEVLAELFKLDAPSRKVAMARIAKATETARTNPRAPRVPKASERVKITWSDPFTARFLAEARLAKTDLELCKRLGLPAFCRGAMCAARSRHGIAYGKQRTRIRPVKQGKVKLPWDDETFRARFLREAPRSSSDVDLCARLGLHVDCRDALKTARGRFGIWRNRPPLPMALAA